MLVTLRWNPSQRKGTPAKGAKGQRASPTAPHLSSLWLFGPRGPALRETVQDYGGPKPTQLALSSSLQAPRCLARAAALEINACASSSPFLRVTGSQSLHRARERSQPISCAGRSRLAGWPGPWECPVSCGDQSVQVARDSCSPVSAKVGWTPEQHRCKCPQGLPYEPPLQTTPFYPCIASPALQSGI